MLVLSWSSAAFGGEGFGYSGSSTCPDNDGCRNITSTAASGNYSADGHIAPYVDQGDLKSAMRQGQYFSGTYFRPLSDA